MPSGVNPNRPGGLASVHVSDLKGKEIAKGKDKVAETVSSRIELATELPNSGGYYLPDIKVSTRTVKDPETRAQIIDVPADRLRSVRTPAEFKTLLTELQTTNKDFLLPDRTKLKDALGGDASNFAYNSITGKRIEKFYDEASALLSKTGLRGEALTAARKELNLAHADAYRGRDIQFDQADTGSYWSYGHDAAYVHVYEKMLSSLPKDHPQREALQNHVDYIFSHKYVDTGSANENNIEKTIGLLAIDKNSRNVVSIDPSTINSPQPSYQTIKVAPNAGGEHAGKQVYLDNSSNKYYFQGTQTEVPADLQSKLVRTPAGEITFRRAQEGEATREGFKFDWNGNNMLDAESINTGWWGHCDTRAVMETIHADMGKSAGVSEYRADTGKTTEFNRADLLEIMASQLNIGGSYQEYGTGKNVSLGENKFGGARWDKRPDTAYMNVNGQWQNFNIHITSMSKPNKPTETEDAGKIFEKYHISENGRSFTENKDLMQTIGGDTNIVDGKGRKIEGQAEFYTVNESGQWIEKKENFVMDPTKDDKVLLGTQIRSIGSRTLDRTYYNPKTGDLTKVPVTFKQDPSGKYIAEEGRGSKIGNSQSLLLARELKDGDDPEGKAKLTNEAIRTGNAIATDSSKDETVWNGAVYKLREDVAWRSEDGRFEKIDIMSESRYGFGKVGSKINELDAQGNVIKTHETSAPVDFFWRDVPRVAPLVNENGKWYINNGMTERGMLDLQKLDASLDTVRNMNDLLYLGLSAKDNQPVYTIVHEGKRLVYSDKAAWEADVKKLETAAGRVTTPPPAPPTPPTNPQ